MKRVLTVLLAACAVFTLVACGGGNNATNAGNTGNHEGHGHGHGDEHGEAHELGEKKVGDYELHVAQVESDSKTEAIFEVKVMKDGKSVKDVPVDVWIGNAEGKELAKVAKGEWAEDEGLFDCHVDLPADMKGARLWVKIRQGDLKAVDFELDKD